MKAHAMIDSLRDIAHNKVVQILMALFLIVPFGFFGMESYFNQSSGGVNTVATVGNQRITTLEFDQALKQQAEVMRQQFRGNFDPALMESPQIRQSVLDKLVSERLVTVGSDRAGIRLSDKALAERIASEPAFQQDGRFSKERYDMVARQNNLTTRGLDSRLREDFAQQQFRSAIADTAFVPKTTLDGFIRLSEQTREVSVVNLGPEAYLAKVQVKPEEVKSYFDANAKEFTIPERARVEFVELSLDAMAAKEAAPAEEVKRVYDEEVKLGRYGQPEERRASHILVSVAEDAPEAAKKAAQAKAEEIAARVRKNPASFAEVAKKESQDPGSGAQGGDLGFFRRGAMVKPFEDAVFAAKPNEIVGPVQSPFGYHVIRLAEVKPAKVKSFADASPEIEAALKKGAAQRRMVEAVETFSNTVYEQPNSLQPVAASLKLQVQQSGWLQKGGPGASPLLSNPKLQAEIFSDDAIKNKRNTSAVEIAPNQYAAARVVEYKPAELRPFDTVKAEIEKRLQREAATKLAKAEGEAKLKQLQDGKDAGVQWPVALAVNRQKPGGLFPAVLDRAFRVDAKKLPGYVGVESPAGYTLVKVSKVIDLEKIEDAQRAALGTQLRNAVVAEEMEATLASLRDRVGVKVSREALEKKPPG
jgi:peptidyl-prolyl cis-trans isomerase D